MDGSLFYIPWPIEFKRVFVIYDYVTGCYMENDGAAQRNKYNRSILIGELKKEATTINYWEKNEQ